MNTEKNQNIWIEKVHQNLILRGRSEKTFTNYKSVLTKFFDYYDENTNIKSLNEENIISFLNHEYIKTNKCKSSYNLAVCSIRLLYLVCFNKSLNRILLPTSKLTTNYVEFNIIYYKKCAIKYLTLYHLLRIKSLLIGKILGNY